MKLWYLKTIIYILSGIHLCMSPFFSPVSSFSNQLSKQGICSMNHTVRQIKNNNSFHIKHHSEVQTKFLIYISIAKLVHPTKNTLLYGPSYFLVLMIEIFCFNNYGLIKFYENLSWIKQISKLYPTFTRIIILSLKTIRHA